MEKKCSKCGGVKPLVEYNKDSSKKGGRYSSCKECNREYAVKSSREYREKHPEKRRAACSKWFQKNKEKSAESLRNWRKSETGKKSAKASRERDKVRGKISARKKVATAIANGSLSRMPCVFCGESSVEAHHHDYSQPLSVVWLCTTHHNLLHKAIDENFKGDYGKSIRDIEKS